MTTKALIFDRDGVILDTEIINVNSAVQAFKKIGISISEKDKQKVFGRNPEDYKYDFLKKYKFSYERYRKIQKETYYDQYDKQFKPNKDILRLIRDLKKNKVKLALTTTATLKGTKRLLKKLKLENIFDVIVTFEDVDKRKPHPDPYLKTLKKLKLSAQECIVIEDTPVGVESAKKAKIKCIAFKTPYIKKKEMAKADLITSSTKQMKTYLRKQGVKI